MNDTELQTVVDRDSLVFMTPAKKPSSLLTNGSRPNPPKFGSNPPKDRQHYQMDSQRHLTPKNMKSREKSTVPLTARNITDLPPPPLNLQKRPTDSAKKSAVINVPPSLTFYTPQTKLAKPLPSAFHSTGLISKKHRPRHQHSTKPTPETPAKKLNFTKWMNQTEQSFGSLASSLKKQRSPLQESPIKQIKSQTEDTPLSMNKINHQEFSVSPSRFPLGRLQNLQKSPQETENISVSPEDWIVRSRCVSTPETALKNTQFTPQHQLSPVKMSKQYTPTARNIFEIHSVVQTTPLRKTEQLHWLSSHQIYTPYPRFISFEYLQRLRDPQGTCKEPFSDADIFPDYMNTHFVVLEKLGSGAFADAFKVFSKSDRVLYAIKKTRNPYAGHKDRMKKLEEVEMMFLVNGSSHTVQLISAWEQYGYLYMQLELCQGGNLQTYLDDASRVVPIEEFQIWHILAQITMALKEIHDKRIIHLDLKPENMFLDSDKIKIGDFGLATFYPVTSVVEREGDRTYIAPEILGSHYDKSADIFRFVEFVDCLISSLGLIILEICANIVLPEYGEYWQMLRSGDFSAIRFGSISPPMLELVKSMLDPNPCNRPTAEIILKHPYVSTIVSTGDCLMEVDK